jgi:hypothetical protein
VKSPASVRAFYCPEFYLTALTGDVVKHFQFCCWFKVEAVNAQFQRPCHFFRLFANTLKYDFGWIAASGDYPFQLTTRDDIEPGA